MPYYNYFLNIRVLGAEPLGEGVASKEVRARGRLSPSKKRG